VAMFLTTRCPRCATTFEVAPDQLQLCNGQVRCGECAMVFDGNACQVDAAPTPPAVLRGRADRVTVPGRRIGTTARMLKTETATTR